jgi:hypothetical protein
VTQEDATLAEPPAKKFRRLMSDFQSRNRAGSSGTTTTGLLSALDTELERFVAEIRHCQPSCDNGLAFWQDKHRQTSFPILAPVALDLVAAPASQAYVERVFSVCVQASATDCAQTLNSVFFSE